MTNQKKKHNLFKPIIYFKSMKPKVVLRKNRISRGKLADRYIVEFTDDNSVSRTVGEGRIAYDDSAGDIEVFNVSIRLNHPNYNYSSDKSFNSHEHTFEDARRFVRREIKRAAINLSVMVKEALFYDESQIDRTPLVYERTSPICLF